MKKKTQKAIQFLDGLVQAVSQHPQFRKSTNSKSETAIQAEIRPLIISYLEKYFSNEGFQDSEAKAHASFYWEGQEGQYGRERRPVFGSRNYPDFIVTAPYLVAVEYKKSAYGSLVKQGIGQSIVHTLSGDFDFVVMLFQDESAENRIGSLQEGSIEQEIVGKLWNEFNVRLHFV